MDLEEFCLESEDDIAPGSMQPVVFADEEGTHEIGLMRWGFKLPDRHLFTARSEGIERAQFWKESFQQRRCIVPADGIFEWAQTEKGQKKPKYEIVIPGRQPFGIAGVWRPWRNPKSGQWERTFAVLTGEPNEVVLPIHHRMTTILEPRDYDEYLADAKRPPLHLLRILPAEEMCITPVEGPEQSKESKAPGQQLGLFEANFE
jgi:Uncharacterized conserved protein